MFRFAGTAAVALGVTYLLIGVVFFLLPADQQAAGARSLLESLTTDGTLLYVTFQWLFVLSGVLGFSVVAGVSRLFAASRSGVVHLLSALGYLGFAAVIIEAFNDLSHVYAGLHGAYAQADETMQSVILGDMAVSGLDLQGWVAFGIVGLWLLGLSILALVDGALPWGAAVFGLVGAVGYWLVPVGSASDTEVLITVAAALAIVVAPVFYIWAGVSLRQAADPTTG